MISGLAKIVDLLARAWDVLKPYAAVYAWERGARLRFGRYHSTLSPGYYFKWPVAERVKNVSTAMTTMRGPTQSIGGNTFKWSCKYRVSNPEAFTVDVFEEDNFLRDVLTGHVADYMRDNLKDTTESAWHNMIARLKREAAEGGFDILKLRLVDDTTGFSFRMFGDDGEME
jgi:regulator of protease activity HflC (stomatin/prohibitin superfamily)